MDSLQGCCDLMALEVGGGWRRGRKEARDDLGKREAVAAPGEGRRRQQNELGKVAFDP